MMPTFATDCKYSYNPMDNKNNDCTPGAFLVLSRQLSISGRTGALGRETKVAAFY
jgi:hypothetical protein